MTIYRLTLEWPNERGFSEFQKSVEQAGGKVLGVVTFHNTDEFHVQRDQEIIAKYQTGNYSSTALGQEYGISRERVCQILRQVNAIGKAQVRKAAARAAMTEVLDQAKAETSATWEAKVAEGLELLRQGKSIRQTVVLLNMHHSPRGLDSSNFGNLLGRRARLAGIPLRHGRHRDMSQRKALVAKLSQEGLTVPAIVAKLRSSGLDPSIHELWVYHNCPWARVRARRAKTGQN